MAGKLAAAVFGGFVIGNRLVAILGSSENTIRGLCVVGGAVGMGVANEMGLDPMPYAVGAAKWVIAAGEQALKQLPEKDGLSHSPEMPEAILSKK